ncbi:hypothetical protein [Epilithonimonas arachidiradicis]|uniref:Uncharacterized protein n=1 Tax=Epilithonimonas arachidiradicis TaxID=1617282 RepID=A0A420DB18_9FLAO|nr:hypothetical protein [Epilithonimonas arachidiradicis]RKE88756.1 hypothetical protein BXY58_0876 [Epilithonimonas arachidiradicis]
MNSLISKNLKVNSLKYLALIPLFLVACKKEPEIKEQKVDTVTTIEKPMDSLSTILKTEKESNQNIVTVDASKMPIRLNLEIKNPDDQLILKLENLNQAKINGYIKTQKPMNLRFNQIRMPDNTFDGPFGPTIEYDTKQKGEYWLILAKSNMADGTPVGKFFVKIE